MSLRRKLVVKVPNNPFSRTLDKDVIWLALIECAFVSEKQLICVVCFARAPGIPLTIDIIRVFSPFFFFWRVGGTDSFWYENQYQPV